MPLKIVIVSVCSFFLFVATVYSQANETEAEKLASQMGELGGYLGILNDQQFLQTLELSPDQKQEMNRNIAGLNGLQTRYFLRRSARQRDLKQFPGLKGAMVLNPEVSLDDLYKIFDATRATVQEKVLLPHQSELLMQRVSVIVLRNIMTGSGVTRKLELTQEQRKRVEEIRADFAKKVADAKRKFDTAKEKAESDSEKKMLEVMSAEQKKIIEGARKKILGNK